ncbi:hypothetical protein M493_10825 [Geobacillus genomosp. 3]|uniref:Uncharacterized protein n=1 Tax=Geobacillus genomosp. 3 TaxID=1921421 RepID=S6A2P7_GEOG3|nr:hypothetical protein M493_10825 [Geobacillus genomosp. 3]
MLHRQNNEAQGDVGNGPGETNRFALGCGEI